MYFYIYIHLSSKSYYISIQLTISVVTLGGVLDFTVFNQRAQLDNSYVRTPLESAHAADICVVVDYSNLLHNMQQSCQIVTFQLLYSLINEIYIESKLDATCAFIKSRLWFIARTIKVIVLRIIQQKATCSKK